MFSRCGRGQDDGVSVAAAAGKGLGLVFGALAHLRPKPLHPKGGLREAVLTRNGADTGVAWLDEPGDSRALVRLSRSLGLPDGLPDVLGIALRVDGGDVLLASSARARGLRHVFLPARDATRAFFTTAFTYSTPHGPVLLGAAPTDDGYELQVAHPSGEWQTFGTLRLGAALPDETVSFDPVQNPLPGLALTPQLAALREPSYAASRRVRAER